MSQLQSLFTSVPLPRFARVRQRLDGRRVEGVRGETRARLLGAGLRQRITAGARVAITAGSRGLGEFTELLNGICDAVRQCGGQPFLVPAMGSHGGATAEGQTELLRRLGVTDAAVPAPICATMETIALGQAETGAMAHLDKFAADADGIIVLGRVKTHPENQEGIASGLLKMTAVGLGKQLGAREAHSHGLWRSVEAMPRLTFARARILFGVAVVENAFREPALIEVVPGAYDAFREADQRLLDVAKAHFVRIPFQDLDVLVVDELGKDISGTGMDLNVIGKWRIEGGEKNPHFRRMVVLSLTPASCGNGLGIGLADFTTERFMREFDFEQTYINLLTATEPGVLNTREGSPPLALASDRAAIAMAISSSLAKSDPRMCRVRNTAALEEFEISEALLPEAERDGSLTVLEPARALAFDPDGNLF